MAGVPGRVLASRRSAKLELTQKYFSNFDNRGSECGEDEATET